MRTDALLQVGEDLRDRLAGLDHHVGEQQADQDAVPLWDVPAHGEAARLLATEDCVGFHHLRRDVLEAHWNFVDALAKSCTQLVGHRGHVHRLDDRAAHAPGLEQVQHQQREHLELVDEASGLVDDADPIGVAVRDDAQVLAADLHDADRRIDVGRDRLGVHAAEQRVALIAQLGHRRPSASDHLRDVSVSGPVHAVVDDAQPGVLDRIEVDYARDLRVIGLARVIRADEPVRHAGLGGRHVLEGVDVPLQLGDDLRWRCAACLGLVLVAVEHVRVVARRDHGGAGRLAVDHCP